MNEFKKGDRIRVTKGCGDNEIGKTYIADLYPKGSPPYLYAKVEEGNGCTHYENWVLAEESKEHQNIPIGTRVRIITCSVKRQLGNAHEGKIGVVEETCVSQKDDHVCVADFDGKHLCCADVIEVLRDVNIHIATHRKMVLTELEKPQQEGGEKKIMAYNYKVGDMFRVISDYAAFRKETYVTLDKDDGSINPWFVDRMTGVGHYVGWHKLELCEPITLARSHKKSIMGKLSTLAAKLLDADTKTLVEAGILNSELALTDEGRDFVLTQVLNTNKKAYAAEAKSLLEEAKKNKGKDC